jgi:heterodisulfide reductase subunit C
MFSIDMEFRRQVLAEVPELTRCFQCGTCVASCLAARYLGDFNPRRKILSVLYGQKDELNDILFNCATCNSCNERCPQDVNPFEVLIKLKNLAVRLGLISAERLATFNQVVATGRGFVITGLTDTTRGRLGLPKVKKTQVLKKVVSK